MRENFRDILDGLGNDIPFPTDNPMYKFIVSMREVA